MNAKAWRAVVGQRPVTVTVYEKVPGGVLYARVWDAPAQRWAVRSLGHNSRERATTWAAETYANLTHARAAAKGSAVPAAAGASPGSALGLPTVRGVMALYVAHRLPGKKLAQQREDRRRSRMWVRLYGTRVVQSLGSREWDDFIRDRGTGTIDPHGHRVEDPRLRQPVSPRAVDADLVFINSVLNWACQIPREDTSGLPVLARNPWAGAGRGIKRVLARPSSRAVRRPVATTARYEAALAVAPRVTCKLPAIAEKGRRKGQRTNRFQEGYLATLLPMAYLSGRRITALCSLTRDRLVWEGRTIVAVRWPPLKDDDEIDVPVHPVVSAALVSHLARMDEIARLIEWVPAATAPVFPQPRALCRWHVGDPEPRALLRWTARDWLDAADALAENPPLKQGCWHPYRRSFATRKKHLPSADVMALAGWKDAETMRRSYEQADAVTTRRALLDDTALG